MHRSLIHAATVCVSNQTTGHHGSYRRKRDQNDENENDPI